MHVDRIAFPDVFQHELQSRTGGILAAAFILKLAVERHSIQLAGCVLVDGADAPVCDLLTGCDSC